MTSEPGFDSGGAEFRVFPPATAGAGGPGSRLPSEHSQPIMLESPACRCKRIRQVEDEHEAVPTALLPDDGAVHDNFLENGVDRAATCGGLHIDDIPDDVLEHVFKLVVRRDWVRLAPVVPLGFEEMAADDDVNLELLASLCAVSRRWRDVALRGCFWERVCVRGATDRSVSQLLGLPPARLAPIKSFYLKFPRAGPATLEAVAGRLPWITGLELDFVNESAGNIPLAHLGAVAQLRHLRSLELSIAERTLTESPGALVQEEVQAALASIASLQHLEALLLQNMPLAEAALRALGASRGLQANLRVLHLDAFLPPDENELEGSPGPAIEALSALRALRQLSIAFRDPVSAEWVGPRAETADLRPLAALTELTLLDLGAYCAGLEHLLAMRRLEDVVCLVDADADALALLRPDAGPPPRFRRLALVAGCGQEEQWGEAESGPRWAPSLVPLITRLEGLRLLQLHGPGEMLGALAAAGLGSLGASLAELRLNNDAVESAEEQRIPLALLRRVAADCPSLTALRLDSPLGPLPEALPALAALARTPLRRLSLAAGTMEALRGDEASFAALRAALPGVLVEEARPEGFEEDEPAGPCAGAPRCPGEEADEVYFFPEPPMALEAEAAAFDSPPHPPMAIGPPPSA
eukprot:tig00001056_g6646.t1